MATKRQLYSIPLTGLGLDSKTFEKREDIKPWLSECLLEHRGIHIVIERSDTGKIIFKCKNGSRIDYGTLNQKRRQTTCPFRIRANYSWKNRIWSILIINDHHDHDHEDMKIKPPSKKKAKTESKAEKSAPESTSNHSSTSDVFSSLMNNDSSSSTTPIKDQELLYSKNNYFGRTGNQAMLDTTGSIGIPNTVNSNLNELTKELKPVDAVAQFLREEVNKLIENTILKNTGIKPKEKTSLMDSFTSQFILDHKDQLSEEFIELLYQNQTKTTKQKTKQKNVRHELHKQKKALVNNWMTPSSSQSMNPAANLIPLFPLLNDSDNEYVGTTANTTTLAGTSMDNLTHLPGINVTTGIPSTNYVMPNQILQIQNQNQQLPSFNTIQNQLPMSPSGNAISNSLFNNTNSSTSSMIPPISNVSNTLNPSHLLKSSNSKNSVFNQGSSLLNEFKINNNPNSSINTNVLMNNSLTNSFIINSNGGTTSPNNNLLNNSSIQFNSNPGFNANTPPNFSIRDNSRDNSSITNSNSNNSGMLQNISSFTDSGW